MTDNTTTEPLFADYMTESEFAAEIDRSPRTLARWRRLRIGPPVTYFGRTPLYRRKGARQWLLSQEREQVRAG